MNLEGKKTFIGIAVFVIGWMGVSHYVTSGEVTTIVDNLFQLIGTALAIYGRIKAKPA
jgi:uncharacterized membrane protein YGL010W